MPPITDPALLEAIKRQQTQPAGIPTGLPTQPQPFPGAVNLVNPRAVTAQKTQEEIPFVAPKAAADVGKTQAEIPHIQAETTKTEGEVKDAQIKRDLYTKAVDENKLYLRDTLNAIGKARANISNWSTGWGGLLKGVPGTDAKALASEITPISANTAFNRLQLTRSLSPTGGSATGQTSDFEQKMLMDSIASLDQTQSKEQFADHLNAVELHFLRSFAAAEGRELPNSVEEGRAMFGLPSPKETPTEKSGSFTHKTIEIPPAYQAEENAFLSAHPPGTLNAEDYLAHRQALDEKFKTELEGGVTTSDPKALKTFIENYNKGGEVTKIPPITREKTGEGAAAGLAILANSASGGLPELATGEEGRKFFAQLAADHPNWAFAGELGGGVLGMKGIGAAGKAGLKLAGKEITDTVRNQALKDVATNVTYGGARGFSSAQEGEGFSGAAKGAGVGLASAALGQFITKGGIPLASKGFQKAREQIGVDSIKGFNRENASRALARIGEKLPKKLEPGVETNDYIHGRFNKAYEDIRPQIGGNVDTNFTNAIAAAKASAKTPEKKAMYSEIQDAINAFNKKGVYDGQGYKEASERLRALKQGWLRANELQGNVPAGDMARVADNVRKQMQTLVQRQQPDVGGRLKNIERGYAHLMQIEDASNRALASNEAQYAPRQYIQSIKQSNPKAASRGRAFDQQYAMAAEKVLGAAGMPKVSLGERFRVASVITGAATPALIHNPAYIAAVSAISYGLYGPETKLIIRNVMKGKRPKAIDNELLRRTVESAMQHAAAPGSGVAVTPKEQ